MKISKQFLAGLLLLIVSLFALRYAEDTHRRRAKVEPEKKSAELVCTPLTPRVVLNDRLFSESVEVRIAAILEYLRRGDPGFEELLSQILDPRAQWHRVVSGGTSEYLKVMSPGAAAQVFTTGVLMSGSRRAGQHGSAEWDAFHLYWDDACMRDAGIALRTGEIVFEINKKSGVALQRLAKNLLANSDPGCRRASFLYLSKRANGDTMGYDPLLPGLSLDEQAREMRRGRPAYACAAKNVEAGERWFAWAKQVEEKGNER